MKKAKIIILSGQSNAAGVGYANCLIRSFSEAKTEEYFNGYEKIKINYISYDSISNGFVITKVDKETIGPELGIAEYLNTKFPDEEFFIVKFAVGSASLWHDFLSPTSGGHYDICGIKKEYSDIFRAFRDGKPTKPGWCYNGLVSVLCDSIACLKENGYDPEIIGFCWMQGESDACVLEHVNNYKTYFDNLIHDFKNEFSSYLKKCIFVDAGISEIWAYYKEMNEIKKEYAIKHENFFYIDTIENDLTTRYEPVEEPDIYHYDCESVIKLGKLFMEKIC